MHSVIHRMRLSHSHNGDYVKWIGLRMNSKHNKKRAVDNTFFKSVFLQAR